VQARDQTSAGERVRRGIKPARGVGSRGENTPLPRGKPLTEASRMFGILGCTPPICLPPLPSLAPIPPCTHESQGTLTDGASLTPHTPPTTADSTRVDNRQHPSPRRLARKRRHGLHENQGVARKKSPVLLLLEVDTDSLVLLFALFADRVRRNLGTVGAAVEVRRLRGEGREGEKRSQEGGWKMGV
jgi:hypothetical protein